MTVPSALLSLLLAMLQSTAHATRCDGIALQWRHYTSFERLAWQAMIEAGRGGREDDADRWSGIRDRHGDRIAELAPTAVQCGIVPTTERKTSRYPATR